jgi:hypothetical protein
LEGSSWKLEGDQLEGNVWQAKMSDANSTNLSIIKITKITVLTKVHCLRTYGA